MRVHIHPHARERMQERGADEEEIMATLERGEQFKARFGRVGFREISRSTKSGAGDFSRPNRLNFTQYKKTMPGWLLLF